MSDKSDVAFDEDIAPANSGLASELAILLWRNTKQDVADSLLYDIVFCRCFAETSMSGYPNKQKMREDSVWIRSDDTFTADSKRNAHSMPERSTV